MKNIITICLLILLLIPAIAFSTGQVDSIQTGVTNFSRQGRTVAMIDTTLYVIYFDSDTTTNRSELLVSYDYGSTWVITDKTPFGTELTFQSDEPSLFVFNDTLYAQNGDLGGTIITKFVGDTSDVVNTPSPPTLVANPGYISMNLRNDSLVLLVDVGSGISPSGFISNGAWGAAATFISSSDTLIGPSATAPILVPVSGGAGHILSSSVASANNQFQFTDGYTNTASHVSGSPWQPISLVQTSAVAKSASNDTMYIAVQQGDSIMVLGGYVDANDSLVITDSVFIDADGPSSINNTTLDYMDPILSFLGTDLYLIHKQWDDPTNNDSVAIVARKASSTELGSLAFSGLDTLKAPTSLDSIGNMNAPAYFADNAVDILCVVWTNGGGDNARALSFAIDTVANDAPPSAAAIKGYHKGVYLKKGKF